MPGPVVNDGRAIAARPRAAHVRPLQRGWIIYACHALTCSFSQSAHSSMPSPVRAQIGMTLAFGLRKATYSRHLSMSKSKYGSTSILLTRTTSQTWNISGYFSGLS